MSVPDDNEIERMTKSDINIEMSRQPDDQFITDIIKKMLTEKIWI